MRPLGFELPVPMILFEGLLVAFAVTEAVIRLRSGTNQSGAKREWASFFVIVVGLVGGIGGAVVAASVATWAAIPFGRIEFFVVGCVLMAFGIAFRIWAVVVLGRFFTVEVQVHDGQTVVDTGPYRMLRHPSYTGLLATCLGIGLALGNWLALIIVIVLPVVTTVFRIRVEERALLAGLGEPSARFPAARARLIPGVW